MSGTQRDFEIESSLLIQQPVYFALK